MYSSNWLRDWLYSCAPFFFPSCHCCQNLFCLSFSSFLIGCTPQCSTFSLFNVCAGWATTLKLTGCHIWILIVWENSTPFCWAPVVLTLLLPHSLPVAPASLTAAQVANCCLWLTVWVAAFWLWSQSGAKTVPRLRPRRTTCRCCHLEALMQSLLTDGTQDWNVCSEAAFQKGIWAPRIMKAQWKVLAVADVG